MKFTMWNTHHLQGKWKQQQIDVGRGKKIVKSKYVWHKKNMEKQQNLLW